MTWRQRVSVDRVLVRMSTAIGMCTMLQMDERSPAMREIWERIAVWYGVKMKLWDTQHISDDEAHVIPLGDYIDHSTETSVDGLTDLCPCVPVTEPIEREDGSIGWLVHHRAADGRETDDWNRERSRDRQ